MSITSLDEHRAQEQPRAGGSSTKGAVVRGYTLKDRKGRGLGKATMVVLANGEEVRLGARLNTRDALRRTEVLLAQRKGAERRAA